MPPERRRIRLTLRGLMLLILCLAVWLGWRVHLARQQREAVAAIKKFGGTVHYDWELGKGPPDGGRRGPPAPAWLREAIGDEYFQDVINVGLDSGDTSRSEEEERRSFRDLIQRLSSFSRLTHLSLSGDSITPDEIGGLAALSHLSMLIISGEQLDDGCLGKLAAMPNLEQIWLSGGHFTDAALGHARGMTGLKSLVLYDDGPHITDAGLAQIRGLVSLKQLVIIPSKITDAGLGHLESLLSLQDLNLNQSSVSEEGKVRLMRKLPGLQTHPN